MSWNHRVMAHKDDGEIYFLIHTVSYNKDNTAIYYAESNAAVSGESLEELSWTLHRMKEALKEPILWAGDKFPNEYNP